MGIDKQDHTTAPGKSSMTGAQNKIENAVEQAVFDYIYLLNRQYPENESIKLVGNRYRLTKKQRHMLYRGLAPNYLCKTRKEKRIGNPQHEGNEGQGLKDGILYIDGYNVLFTVMNYLLGKTLFIANDGLLRDTGESYGKIENINMFIKAAGLVTGYLNAHGMTPYIIYLDQKVTGNDHHVAILENQEDRQHPGNLVITSTDPDQQLKEKASGIIVTSDSEIVDATPCRVLDLAYLVLSVHYNIDEKIINLDKLCSGFSQL